MSASLTPDAVRAIVVTALAQVVPGVAVGDETTLVGDSAVIDSVGFVTLLVEVEQGLNGRVDLATSFLQHGSTIEDSPFRTVATLVRHIQDALEPTSTPKS